VIDLSKMHHVDHPEDERYDEIHITCVERWKESELSGDEWRFSYRAEIKRKGETVLWVTSTRLKWLLMGLEWRMLTSGEENKFDMKAWERTKTKCDQPGCAAEATIYYGLKKRWNHGDELAPNDYFDGKVYRQFCEKHKTRGDCDLDDADHNYVLWEVSK
jgi:hypothetical protein